MIAIYYSQNSAGKEISRWTLYSSSTAQKLVAVSDRTELKADGQDLAYVTIQIADEYGKCVFPANNNVTVEVQGEGILAAIGTGNPVGEECFAGKSLSAYEGRVLAIIRTTKKAGIITLSAKSEGLLLLILYYHPKLKSIARRNIDKGMIGLLTYKEWAG